MKNIILDSEAISQLARSKGKGAQGIVQDAIRAAATVGAPVIVPAAVLAEQYRWGSHDQLVDACLSRYPGIEIENTTRSLARSIGNILGRAKLGSEHHVDAAVIATATARGGGVILTSDPDDLERLAAGNSAITIVAI